MKRLIFILFIIASCKNSTSTNQAASVDSSKLNSSDTIIKSKNVWLDRLNGVKYPLPDTIAGKPISFYLDNPKVAAITKDFYKGQFRPTDNDSTIQLLSFVSTNDSTLRPFYRWCLDFTITISDGALGEYPGMPALAYATKFPEEFFNYMDEDMSRQRYEHWTEIIAYSGLNNYNRTTTEIEKEIISNMLSNCHFCDVNTKSRILAFAHDITKALKLQD
ncbi:MAG: hypothetical protein JNK27_11280 [Chitinophagaceae bacterium]|nr:hypothetical protein [Chitinophagaceae bacterium]